MKIKLATVNLEVAVPEKSKRFYIDVLGMKENLERSHAPGFVYLESPGCSLTLGAIQGPPQAQPAQTMELGFETDDLDSIRSHLDAQGPHSFQPKKMGWGDVLEGHDPDGHRVIVYSFKRR